MRTQLSADILKGLRSVWPLVATVILASAVASVYAVALASAGTKGAEGGFVPAIILWPIFFLVGFVVFFFVYWSPLLGLALVLCAVIPSRRRVISKWHWATSCTVFILCLPLFYLCLREVLGMPGLKKYPPFDHWP